MTTLTFVIPVRHYLNASNWPRLKANLQQTMASIGAQTHGDWRGLVVANEGSDLPPLPDRFDVEWVKFPPNEKHDVEACDSVEEFQDAVRFDKGRRILSGMLRARESRYLMVVDDDDFINSRIVKHVADHAGANGWVVDHGYLWSDGGLFLMQHDDFNMVCGTSLIVRSDLLALPPCLEDAAPEYIKNLLGSHVMLKGILADRGTPLQRLPFRGAIYRVGQVKSHSRIPGILSTYFLNRRALRRPRKLMREMKRLKIVTRNIRRQFFG